MVIQNVYLIIMMIGVVFIDFPVPKKTLKEKDLEMSSDFKLCD